MGKNTDPPKCRTCGKVEWRHVCGRGMVKKIAAALPRKDAKAFEEAVSRMVNPPVVTDSEPLPPQTYPAPANTADGVMCLEPGTAPGLAPPSAKISRKEYLKLKARERRAAKKVGLTVAEYRKQKEAKA